MDGIMIYNSPVGPLAIQQQQEAITHIYFPGNQPQKPQIQTALLKEAAQQLDQFFSGRRKVFKLPLNPSGTEFQRKVWDALCKVPYGTTASYKDIAVLIGSPKACRAVGMANNKNTIPIIIPCHRVIGADGRLVGYGGGLEIKKRLLNLEGVKLNS